MIKETTLYSAVCDRCEKELQEDLLQQPASELELKEYLDYYRWHDTGQLHFCPNCYTIDQNGEIKLKPQINETND